MSFFDEDHGAVAGAAKGAIYTALYTPKATVAGLLVGLMATAITQNPYFAPSGLFAGMAVGGMLKTNLAIKGVAMQEDSMDAWGILGGCFLTTTGAGLASIQLLKYTL